MLGGIQDGIGMECENLAFLLVYFDHVIEIPIGTAHIDSLPYERAHLLLVTFSKWTEGV